jgi:hypothetical protein
MPAPPTRKAPPKPPTRSTPPPPKRTPANPTASRLATQGIAAPPAPPAPESDAAEAADAATAADAANARLLDPSNPMSVFLQEEPVIPGATDDADDADDDGIGDYDISMLIQQETERASRRREAELRNQATLSGTVAPSDHDPARDFEAPLAMPNLANLVLFECPGKLYLEIQVGDHQYIKFRNGRYRTNDPTELNALRSKKLRQRHGIYEATSDGITEELFWSAKGSFWHSDAARLEYDRINLPGRKEGDIKNPWPA